MMEQQINTMDVMEQYGMLYTKRIINKIGLILLFLTILPLVSAVDLSDTVLQSEGLNLTINITSIAYADSVTVSNQSIYFENFRRSGSEYITMNLTSANKNYTGNDLPYFAQTSLTEKHIASNLTDTVTTSVTLSARCDWVGRIIYTSDSGNYTHTWNHGDYTCENNQITLDNIPIEPALNSNVFTLEQNQAIQSSCGGIENSFTSIIVIIGLIFSIIFIVSIIGVLLSAFGIIPEIEVTDNITLTSLIYGTLTIAGLGILVITIIYLFESGLCPIAGA